MRTATLIIIWIVRLAGITQLVLGTLFWTGNAINYIPVHIMVGFVFVLALWTLAVLALIARARRGLAVFALLWGIALPAFGIPQATILIGPMHWIIRVIHLLMGLAALGVADRLAKAILAAQGRRAGQTTIDGTAAARPAS